MKKTGRKLICGALALVLVFSLAACGQKDKTEGGDPASVMLSAQQELKKVSSMSYTYAMEMSMTADGETTEISVDGTADMTLDPAAVKMTMNMKMLGMELKDMQIYMVPEGSQVVNYVGMDMMGTGENQWYKSLSGDTDLGISTDQYNAVDSFELYMKNGSGFKAAGTETVQGVSATRYEGVISSDMLDETLKASGSMDSITSMIGEDDAEVLDVLNKAGGIPITIWINDEGLPVKYVFDMTTLLGEIIKSAAQEGEDTADVGIDKFVMSMEVLGYNSVEAITVPQEVLDSATEIES